MSCFTLTLVQALLSSIKWSGLSVFMTLVCYLLVNPGVTHHHVFFVSATEDNPLLSYDILYTNGVNSYLENDWASCISYLEHSLNDWHWWNKNVARCREICYEEAHSAHLIFPNSKDYELDRAFEKLVLNTLCLEQCKKAVFGARLEKTPPLGVFADFQKKKPYDYLQLCYYKHGLIDKAADAAATIITSQPDHETMLMNLKFYIKEGGLKLDTVNSMEMDEYAKEFLEGDRLYSEEDYAEAIVHLEKSLEKFWESLQECRLGCEEPFDMGWFPDFVSSVSNHYTFTLRCKVNGLLQLSSLYVEEGEDIVTSILNYLQYSYYKMDNLQKASEAVGSILLLTPNDPHQIKNKAFFMNEGDLGEEFFTPRKNVVNYKERKDAEGKLLAFIDEKFSAIAKKPENETEALDPSISETLLEIADLFAGADDPKAKDDPKDKDSMKEYSKEEL